MSKEREDVMIIIRGKTEFMFLELELLESRANRHIFFWRGERGFSLEYSAPTRLPSHLTIRSSLLGTIGLSCFLTSSFHFQRVVLHKHRGGKRTKVIKNIKNGEGGRV